MESKVRSVVTLKDGVRCEAVSRDQIIVFDESLEDGGGNSSVTPLEGLLASIGGCQAITARYLAKLKGINLNSFRIEVEGDIDLSGYKGVKGDIGFHNIQYIMHIDADNTKEEIEDFAESVERHCPASETIKHIGDMLPTKVIIGK